MSTHSSAELHNRFLTERSDVIRQRFDTLLHNLVSSDAQAKVSAASALIENLRVLKSGLSRQDTPAWVTRLEHELQRYVSDPGGHGPRLINALIEEARALRAQRWDLEPDDEEGLGVDFADLFNRCVEESRLSELYEELVRQLEAVIASGEIDSLKVIRNLERLIATIRCNMRGSYVSVRGLHVLVSTVVRNLVIEAVHEVPVLRTLAKAIEKTIDEIDEQAALVDQQGRSAYQIVAAEYGMRIPSQPSPLSLAPPKPMDEQRPRTRGRKRGGDTGEG